jgi:hypothetical protein
MASAELSRRVEKVVGYPPLGELSELQRREFHEALLEAASFEDPPAMAAGDPRADRIEELPSSGSRASWFALLRIQPGVEDPDRVIQAVGSADCGEGLTASRCAGAAQHVERRER